MARSFLNALLRGDEVHASQYLSTSMQNAIRQYCPNGEVTACLDELGRDEWGALEGIIFDYGRPRTGSYGFSIRMENRPGLFVVVIVAEENRRWVVNGWRGFTQETDGMIDGTNQTNAFPPIAQ